MSFVSSFVLFSLMVLISLFGVGCLRLYSIKKNWLDQPLKRSSHDKAIPNIGGIVILLTLLVTVCFLFFINRLHAQQALLWVVLLLALGISGFIDDRRGLPIILRLGVQLVIAIFVVSIAGGIQRIELGITTVELKWVSYLLGVIWIVGFVNMYNFMDGINGLAGSQAFIAGLFFALWFYYYEDFSSMWLSLAISASSLGFLYWNITPARVFMGDAGSTLLGGSFALLSLELHNHHSVAIIFTASLFAWFLIDSSYTFSKRLLGGKPVWQAHREHFYQKIAPSVKEHTKVTGMICAVTLIISTIASLILLR